MLIVSVIELFTLSFMFGIMCGLIGQKRICQGFSYHLFISIVFGDQLSRVICWDTITLIPLHFVPVSIQDFQRHMSWSCLSSVDWGMRLLFVLLIMLGISVDHHCLNSFFIMSQKAANFAFRFGPFLVFILNNNNAGFVLDQHTETVVKICVCNPS